MRMSAIALEHCPPSVHGDDVCYLLSQDALEGSIRSLDCLALGRERGHRNLPAFRSWGFVAPRCWSYVEVQRRSFRSAKLTPPGEPVLARLASEAAQEWAHPDDARRRSAGVGPLRLAVLGSCLPLLLDDVPHQLAQGHVRHDAVSTTVSSVRPGTSGSAEEARRVSVVVRVSVDPRSDDALGLARQQHAAALNPVALALSEAPPPAGVADGGGEGGGSRTQRLLRRRIRQGAAMLLVNVGVIALNAVVIVRGVHVWQLMRRFQVVEWVQRVTPHMPVTIRAMRALDWSTLPFRRLLAPLLRVRPALRARGGSAAASAVVAAGKGAGAGTSSMFWQRLIPCV